MGLPTKDGRLQYGSIPWLEARYEQSEEDPWGLTWRAVEQCRYDYVIELAKSRGCQGLLSKKTQLSVLDVGCATGNFTHRLAALGDTVLGIDLSNTAIARARRAFPEINFVHTAASDLNLASKRFDLICCLEVLYYVEKSSQREFLSDLRDLLKPDGCAVISSVIGQPPKFHPCELASQLEGYFRIQTVNYYGCAAWAFLEGFFFHLVRRCAQIQWLLTLEPTRAEKEIAQSAGGVFAKRLGQAVIRAAAISRISSAALAGLSTMLASLLRALLGAKSVAAAFNSLAAKLSLSRTHTIVLVTRT